MKKIMILSFSLIIIILTGVGYSFMGKNKVEIISVDANGTQIQPSYKKYVYPLSYLNKYVSKYDGYRLVNNPFMWRVKPGKIIAHYQPKDSSNKLKKRVDGSRYVATAFQDVNILEKKGNLDLSKKPYEKARLRIILSDDGVHWKRLATNYPDILIRDPDMMKYGKYYYIAYTVGLIRTKDFEHWEKVNWNPQSDGSTVWAPSFLRAANGEYYIIASKRLAGQQNFEPVLFPFSPRNAQVGENILPIQQSNLPSNSIDSRVNVINNMYFLWYKDVQSQQIRYATSQNLASGYKVKDSLKIPYKNGWSYEGVDVDATNNYLGGLPIRVYFDIYNSDKKYYGVNYTDYDITTHSWSKYRTIKSDFLVRHFGIMTLR